MNNRQCSIDDSCSAPLCPASAELNQCCWYAAEEICRGRKVQSLPWVKKQKRIARLKGDSCLFFTVGMLLTIDRVTKSLKGADPDICDGDKKWLKTRAERKARSSHRKPGNRKIPVLSPL